MDGVQMLGQYRRAYVPAASLIGGAKTMDYRTSIYLQ